MIRSVGVLQSSGRGKERSWFLPFAIDLDATDYATRPCGMLQQMRASLPCAATSYRCRERRMIERLGVARLAFVATKRSDAEQELTWRSGQKKRNAR